MPSAFFSQGGHLKICLSWENGNCLFSQLILFLCDSSIPSPSIKPRAKKAEEQSKMFRKREEFRKGIQTWENSESGEKNSEKTARKKKRTAGGRRKRGQDSGERENERGREAADAGQQAQAQTGETWSLCSRDSVTQDEACLATLEQNCL